MFELMIATWIDASTGRVSSTTMNIWWQVFNSSWSNCKCYKCFDY